MIKLTAKELALAAAWVEEHVAAIHEGNLPYADIALRHFGNSGLGGNTLVMCEACESKPGNAGNRANYREVTDYDCW